MNIPRDKYYHFAIGMAISAATLYWVYMPWLALFNVVLAELIKIFAYDLPRNPQLPWQEKGYDMLAQVLGSLLAIVLFTVV